MARTLKRLSPKDKHKLKYLKKIRRSNQRRKNAEIRHRPNTTSRAEARDEVHPTGQRRRGACHRSQKINLWKEEHMLEAITEFRAQNDRTEVERLSVRGIATAWNVPYTTFRKRICNLAKAKRGASEIHLHSSGRPTVLSIEEEVELAEHLRKMAEIGFPCDQADVRKLAYEYAQRKGITGFSSKKHSAGYYWFIGFLQRHPELSVKKSENLSIARAMGMNETQVLNWFQKYKGLCSQLGIFNSPSRLWNADETGCQNIQKSDKVIGESGKPTYNVTGGDKGETTTALVCVNALGSAVPPMVIHKGMKVGKLWSNGARHNVIVQASESAYINKELFLQFGQSFVKHLRDTGLLDGNPHLLLLDSHYSHLFNIAFLELMKENNVSVLPIPAHTSHWLQPLDRGVFRSFKQGWQMAMKEHARGRKLDKKEFFRVFNSAWDYGVTVDNIQGGFRGCGLVPYNTQAIPRHAYTPSSTSERRLSSSVAGQLEDQSSTTVQSGGGHSCTSSSQGSGGPAVMQSGDVDQVPNAVAGQSEDQSSITVVTFEDIMPFPKRERSATRQRKKPPSYELTSDDTLSFVRAAENNKVGNRGKRKCKSSSKPEDKSAEVVYTARKKAQSKPHLPCQSKKKKKSKTDDNTECTLCHHR